MKILSNKQYNKIMAVTSALHCLATKQEHVIKEQHALIEKQKKTISVLLAKDGANVEYPNTEGRKNKIDNSGYIDVNDIFTNF